MKYKVLMYCLDCTGVDPAGCFEGGTEMLSKADLLDWREELPEDYLEDAVFDSKEEADDAFHKHADGAPWRYDLIEVSE